MTLAEALEIALLGVVAGLFGGLAGLGGSMVILPGLHMILKEKAGSIHHLYMAAAMTVNVAVALPASLRHRRLGAVRTELLMPLLASTVAFMIIGVVVSNYVKGEGLKLLLGIFICIYCLWNVWRVVKGAPEVEAKRAPTTRELALCGGSTGFAGGLMGLGGGVLLVPLLQVICRVPVRNAVATSSAVIGVTAIVGAGVKLLTLPQNGYSIWRAFGLAAIMAPGAVVGGIVGAGMTHSLKLMPLRLVISVLLLGAGLKLLGAW